MFAGATPVDDTLEAKRGIGAQKQRVFLKSGESPMKAAYFLSKSVKAGQFLRE